MICSNEDFVSAWQRSKTTKEVAEKTGMTVQYCTMRAARFRKLGVPLKMLRKRPTPIDVTALTKLAKSLNRNGDA